MMSLADLLAQNQPQFQTHPALLVIGLQNDFIKHDGRLPVSNSNGFLDRIGTLIPKFRQLSANVIWIQTIYEADRMANDPSTGEGDAVVVGGLVDGLVDSSTDDDDDLAKDHILPTQSRSSKHKQRALDLLKRVSARRRTIPREEAQAAAEEDEELFLLKATKKGAACQPNTPGADFADFVKPRLEPSDTIVQTSNYSAFQDTSLLLILRAKLVTELYICGCITNVSVLATVIDAARHGIKINVVEDCLGFRRQPRHDMALKRMAEFFDAYVVNSKDIFNADNPLDIPQKPALQNGSKNPVENLEDLVGKLQLGEDGLGQQPQDRSSKASSSRAEFPAVTANSRQRTPSITSKAEGRATTDTKLSDEQFAELLTQGAKIPIDERDKPPPPKQSLVKSKIRMRTRSSKSKKEEREGKEGDKKSKGDSKKGESSSQQAAADPATGAPAKSSTAGVATVEAPRPPAITKAESSDKLRESPSKHQKSLKASTSQPALSSVGLESTLRLSPSRMRLALSRSSKSDSKAPATQPPKSPAKIPTETRKPPRSPTKPTAKSSDTSLGLPAGPTTEALVTPLKSPARASEVTEPPKSSVRSTVEEKVSPPEQHTQTTIQQVATSSNSPAKAPVLTTLPSSPSKTSHKMGKKLQSLSNLPVLGPGDAIAEGDSRIIYNFFPADFKHPSDPSTPLKDVIFQQLYSEIRWQKMLHQTGEVPRLVCCQGEFGADGSMPIYRHPTDQALPLLHFSPRVRTIQKQAEKLVGHPLNHVLIQLYRSGQDFISEHSDKTLDITRGSSIVNISFGAQRTMRLRTKKAERAEEPQETTSRNTQRVAMPHNSMFILGLKSNQQWVHSIQPDKRLPAERSELEEAYGGARISLTFRNISTFLDAEENKIWGQGATSKEQRDAQDVINDDEEENEKVVRAFSRENHQSEFVWDEWYGAGFDVLHFHSPPEDIPILFASPSSVENRMVALFLSETKINHLYLAAPALDRQYEQDRQICYRDNDVNHTQVVNAVPIICYLNQYHAIDHDDRGRACTAASHEIFAILCTLLKFWNKRDEPACLASFVSTAEVLEDRHNHGPGPFIAGRRFSIGDCAIWPALDDIIMNWDGWSEEKFPCLTEYYRMLWKKRKTVTKLRAKLPEIKMTAKGKDEKEDDSLVQMFGNVVIGKRTNEKE